MKENKNRFLVGGHPVLDSWIEDAAGQYTHGMSLSMARKYARRKMKEDGCEQFIYEFKPVEEIKKRIK